MVEPQPSKLMTWVRFPLPAPRLCLQLMSALPGARPGVFEVMSSRRSRGRKSSAHVAQLVEHVLGKDEVTGSIPVVSSIRPVWGRWQCEELCNSV